MKCLLAAPAPPGAGPLPASSRRQRGERRRRPPRSRRVPGRPVRAGGVPVGQGRPAAGPGRADPAHGAAAGLRRQGDRDVVRATGRGPAGRPGGRRPALPRRAQDPHDGRLRADRDGHARRLPRCARAPVAAGLPPGGARAAGARALPAERVPPGARFEGGDRPPPVRRPGVRRARGRGERAAGRPGGAPGALGRRAGAGPPAAAAAAARAVRPDPGGRGRGQHGERGEGGARGRTERAGGAPHRGARPRWWRRRCSRPPSRRRTGRSWSSTSSASASSASWPGPTRCSGRWVAACRAGPSPRPPTLPPSPRAAR